MRQLRRDAGAPQGRRARRHPQPPSGVPAADGAGARLVRSARHADRTSRRRRLGGRRHATCAGCALDARPDRRRAVIQLKSPREIDIMARGGQILGATVEMLRREVRAGMSTWQLDEMAESFIRSHTGATPSFKGLYGFPGSVCVSINEEIVHGIPSRRRVLHEGDIISIDVGVKYEGYHTDSATTVAVGPVPEESRRLLDVTQQALDAGIDAAQPGNHVGDIGAAIQTVVE